MAMRDITRQYTTPCDRLAWVHLIPTLAAYCASMALALMSLKFGLGAIWLTIFFTFWAAAFGVRLYMIQHDCMHRTFFKSRRLNDIVGTVISPVTMTPYQATRFNHNLHHAHVSDLDRRDAFEIYVMTASEYAQASRLRRMGYRLYRSPIVMSILGPFILYLILRRFPKYAFKTGVWDVILHDIAIILYGAVLYRVFGMRGVCVMIGSIYLATLFGALIPYIVHNFEDIHWGRKPDLDFKTAALQGSAVLDFGWFFDVMTLNIGYHDLHHLNANIPGYYLKTCHKKCESYLNSHRIPLGQGIACLQWKLYDEENGKMIRFPPFWADLNQNTLRT